MTMIDPRFLMKSSASDAHPGHAPDKPEILSPLDGDENINQAPQIQCSEYRHHYNAPMYGRQIQISSSDDFNDTNIVYELEELSQSTIFQVPLDDNDASYLEEDTEYYVRVRYQDKDLRWSAWSETSCFRTMAAFPETVLKTPLIVTPPDGGFVLAFNPLLAMSNPATLAGEETFSAADWQIAADRDFSELLYSAAGSTDLTVHETANVDLKAENAVDFFVRGRQKTAGGLYTPWSAPARVRRQPEYASLIFGTRRVFSKKRGNPSVWQIDEEGNRINLPRSYFDNHPLYAFPLQDITVSEGLTSSVAYVPPCWIKYAVYDNDDGDMVIDLWFSPYAKTGGGWMLHPAFAKSPRGFYHGTCLGTRTQDSGGTSYYASQYDKSGIPLNTSTNFDALANLLNKDSDWHVWNIYERRLLLDLMQAECQTFAIGSISVGSGIGNDSAAFKWRVFRGFANLGVSYGYYRAITVSGIGPFARQYNGDIVSDLAMKSPLGSMISIPSVSISLTGSTWALLNVLRGENEDLGFDVALLGLPSDIQETTPEGNPYGLTFGKSLNYSAETQDYCAYSPDICGLFALIPYTSNDAGGTGYPRLSKSVN